MKTFTLTGTDIVAPNIVLGLMRIGDKSDDEVRELVRTARDAGIDFVDHADVYGGDCTAASAGSPRRWRSRPPSGTSSPSRRRPGS